MGSRTRRNIQEQQRRELIEQIGMELDDCMSRSERDEVEVYFCSRQRVDAMPKLRLRTLQAILDKLRFYEDRVDRRRAVLAGVRHRTNGSYWREDE